MGRTSGLRVATATAATAAGGLLCLRSGGLFALPGQHGALPRKAAASDDAVKAEGPGTPSQQVNTVLGSLEVALGVGMVLLGSGLLHARADARRGSARTARRANGAAATAGDAASLAPTPTPVTAVKTTKAGEFDVASQAGVTAPYGEPGVYCWDPAGLSRDIDAATFRWYRQAELKHGRVCMMAVVGLLAQHTWRFNLLYPYEAPSYDFTKVPSGMGAATEGSTASPFLGILVLAAGLVELRASDDGREPGDFGDPVGFARSYGLDFDGLDDRSMWQNFELNHGRLAMVGVIGALLAEYATGLDAIEQWGAAGAAFRRTFAITQPQGPVAPLESFL